MPLEQVQKTFIGSLSSRAQYGDEKAKEVIAKLQEIQNKTNFFGNRLGQHKFIQAKERTDILDEWAQKWIDRNPTGRILNVGVGFCTRRWRLDIKGTYWTELDFPEMIELRRQVLPIEEPTRHVYIGHDLKDPHNIPCDLLIGEGVFMHMPEAWARLHIKGECMFDVLGLGRKVGLGATQRWRWDPDTWDFEILDKKKFDVSITTAREAWALWVRA